MPARLNLALRIERHRLGQIADSDAFDDPAADGILRVRLLRVLRDPADRPGSLTVAGATGCNVMTVAIAIAMPSATVCRVLMPVFLPS